MAKNIWEDEKPKIREKDLYLCEDFKSEKNFREYLIDNKDFWISDYWGQGYKEFQKEWYLSKLKLFGKGCPRIDLMIVLNDGKRIGIEIKNPKQSFSELSKSISQLLAYGIIAKNNKVPFDEMVIISSKLDPILYNIIREFKLPIRIFIVNKKLHCEVR